MAAAPDRLVRSADLASHHRTHAVVVRRVLGQLRDAGLVHSMRGHDGGWALSRLPTAITLADVWRALGERLDVASGLGPENPTDCAVERALHGCWDHAVAAAEAALLARLATVSLDQMSHGVPPDRSGTH
jgi:Rrf2 family protein